MVQNSIPMNSIVFLIRKTDCLRRVNRVGQKNMGVYIEFHYCLPVTLEYVLVREDQ